MPRLGFQCQSKKAASVSTCWKLYAFRGISYKCISHCEMFGSQKSAGIIITDMMCTTASCQVNRIAYFPTVCECMKRISADWCNRINVAMEGTRAKRGHHVGWKFISLSQCPRSARGLTGNSRKPLTGGWLG